jgi:lysophospholipase L1-like esterase
MGRFGLSPQRVARLRASLRLIAVNAALLSFSILLAAGLAEVAVRSLAPQQLILIRPDLWQPADTVGWLHQPNVHVRINTGEGPVDVFTDSRGLRVGPDGPTSGERSVLVLGDSFMEALQVQHEETFSAVLEDRLTEDLGFPVTVRNAGVGGWGPEQYLLRATSLLEQEEFDVVVTGVYLGNDVVSRRQAYFPPRARGVRSRFRMPASLAPTDLVDAFLRPVNDFLEVRSHFFLFVRTRLQAVRMSLGLAPLNFPPEFLKVQESTPDWALTSTILEDLSRVAADHGAQSVFLLIPAPFQVDSASLRTSVSGFDLDLDAIDLDQPNERLMAELGARGLRVVDPLSAFRATHDRGERLYGSVDPHFTAAGHRLLVDILAPVATDLIRSSAPTAAQGSASH